MSPFSLAIIIFIIIYLGWIAYQQRKQTIVRNESIFNAQVALQQAEQESKQARQRMLTSITNAYGRDAADKVNGGKIWIGMPVLLLPLAAGKAQDIKENLYKDSRTEKWYYGGHINRLGNTKYKLEVTVEDGTVAGWRDLQ
jgi:hypothetical protein